MNRPSTMASLVLFARMALRRLANRSANFKLSRQTAATNAEPRSATPHRDERQSPGRRLFGLFMPLAMTFGLVLLGGGTLIAIIESVRQREALAQDVMPISNEDYRRLEKAEQIGNADAKANALDELFSSLSNSSQEWQKQGIKAAAHERFQAMGIRGFRSVEPEEPWQGSLAIMSPEARQEALRATGLYLLVVYLSLTGMAIGFMSKNVSGADPALLWLWQFPLSPRVLFLSRLTEYVFDSPLALAVGMLSAVPLWGCGCSFGVGLALAVPLALGTALSGAAMRLAMEVTLLQKCSRKVRGAIVAAVTGIGNVGMLLAMFAGNTRITAEAFAAAAQYLPSWLWWNPWSQGFGTEAMLQGLGSGWWLVPPALALLLCAGAVWLATALTAHGLACGQDAVRDTKKATRDGWTTAGLFRGLVWKELAQLRRQPEYLGQVLLVIPLILFLLCMAAPEWSLSLATQDARALCVAVFVSGTYLLLVAGGQVLVSELKNLTFLQSQPRTLADCIRIKARVWGTIAALLSLPLIGWALVVHPNERLAILVRLPFMLAYLWLAAELIFGILSLGATVLNEQTVRFRQSARWLPGLIAGVAASAVFEGNVWGQSVVLVLLVLLNAAVRQRQQFELNWLSEPVESPPRRLYAMHGLLLVLGFMFLQSGLSAGLAAAKLSPGEVWTYAYCASAVVCGGFSWLWWRRAGFERTAAPTRGPVCQPLLAGLALSCVAGFGVVTYLRHAGQTAAAARIDLFSSTGAGYETWLVVAMIVLVAPPVEEWMFRGLLYRSFRASQGVAASVALSSLLFTAIHPFASSVGVLVLAIATSLAVEKTGRLWPSILIHMGYNLFIVALWNVPGNW